MSDMVVVCGKCNVQLVQHPVEQCPYEYRPISLNGRVYGYRMIEKKNEKKKKNGKAEKEKGRAAKA